MDNTECCLSKNANWKQITTNLGSVHTPSILNVVYQRTQIESKSQLELLKPQHPIYWMLFIKERKLKANHNEKVGKLNKNLTECCLSKIANWKQISTEALKKQQAKKLNVVYQRTQIESKSQPWR